MDSDFDAAAPEEPLAQEALHEEAPGEATKDWSQVRAEELAVWQRFRAQPNQADFDWLHKSHAPLIQRLQQRNLATTTLPKAAVRSDGLRQYIHALKTWNPAKGAFSTHLGNKMQHNLRYLMKFQNIGKIPEERASVVGLFQNRLAHLRETLGREPSNAELADDMNASMADVAELQRRKKKITPGTVQTLRREVRRDLLGDQPGGQVDLHSSKLGDHLAFLHGSLSPDQQVILEHTFDGFGKPVIENPMELAPVVGMSPQKVRALRKQIAQRVQKYW